MNDCMENDLSNVVKVINSEWTFDDMIEMEDMFSRFLELMNEFEKNNVDYILIGGIAINIHGFARNTEDIDLFINPTETNVDKLRISMNNIFHDNEINEITVEELEKYAVIRYGTHDDFYIDIISKIDEQFRFQDLTYEEKFIEGVRIRVADLNTLYKLKENTYREIDQLDIKFLKTKMNN